MRWKVYGDVRENPYRCCWFIHVRTGTVLLGLYSLVNQIIGLLMVSYMLSHPDTVPEWMSFEVSRIGVPQDGPSICEGVGVRHKRDVGHMMDHMPMMRGGGPHGGPMMPGGGPHGGRMMPGGPMMPEHHGGPMMSDWDPHSGPMMPDVHGPMHDNHDPVPHRAGEKKSKALPSVDELLLPRQMLPDVHDKVEAVHDSVGVQLADVLSHPDNKVAASHDDDERGLILPVGHQSHSVYHLREFPPNRRLVGFSADDTFFMYAMMICCIAASLMLIIGIIKARPGHMIPFMGLQAFDFIASTLFMFAVFSYLPHIRSWLLSLPDSFPFKCEMLAMKSERLMLSIILFAVCVIVTKAYLMGVVWSCYKYLMQVNEARGRRRSLDSELAQSPEDAELLLPPKYEDIADVPSQDTEAPPPYVTG